jgi:hypothetical protein
MYPGFITAIRPMAADAYPPVNNRPVSEAQLIDAAIANSTFGNRVFQAQYNTFPTRRVDSTFNADL